MLWIILIILLIVLLVIPYMYKKVIAIETENKDKQEIKILRTKYVFGYFAASIMLYLLFVIFYKTDWFFAGYREYILKITFCIASSCFGLYLNGFKWRNKSRGHPFPRYILLYPFILFTTSIFSFGAISIFIEKMNLKAGMLHFYFLAFPINIYLAHFVDNLPAIKPK